MPLFIVVPGWVFGHSIIILCLGLADEPFLRLGFSSGATKRASRNSHVFEKIKNMVFANTKHKGFMRRLFESRRHVPNTHTHKNKKITENWRRTKFRQRCCFETAKTLGHICLFIVNQFRETKRHLLAAHSCHTRFPHGNPLNLCVHGLDSLFT